MTHTVTLTLDTSAYADGDLLADTQLVHAAVGRRGRDAYLDSVKVYDLDDQGIAFDLVLLDADRTLGTENGAPNVSDANVIADVVAKVAIVAADFSDLGGCKVADKSNLNIPLNLLAGGGLWIAAISRGAGTYTVNGVQVKLGVIYK